MHVTPDSPITDRAAVVLANGVLYAGQDRPDPSTPATVDTHTGPWTPTADEWTHVCHLVDVIVTDDAMAVLIGTIHRLAARPGGVEAALSDLVLVDHWHHTDPRHRAAALVRLAWEAIGNRLVDEADVTDPAHLQTARRLQDEARAHNRRGGHTLTWFGGPDFPVAWPDHAGTRLARDLVDEADEDGAAVGLLHVALLLSAAR